MQCLVIPDAMQYAMFIGFLIILGDAFLLSKSEKRISYISMALLSAVVNAHVHSQTYLGL